MKEPIAARLVRLWNMGADRIHLTVVEAEKKTEHYSLSQRLHTLRLCEGDQSFMDWLNQSCQ